MLKIFKNKKGTTFIELLLYISIFLVITPILVYTAVNYLKVERNYNLEKEVNSESQIVAERIYDIITNAKKIDFNESVLNSSVGRLVLTMQDDSELILELNPTTNIVEITEAGVTNNLTSTDNKVNTLYFEKIEDALNHPGIAIGINIQMGISGRDDQAIEQEYILSANLERGDYDDDGCPDYIDVFPEYPSCCGDADSDGICDEMDNCVLTYNPYQEDADADQIGDNCDPSVGESLVTAFNCSPEGPLLDLIYSDPPMSSSTLKQILVSSSPVPPSVLQALIDEHPLLTNGHFKQVFLDNTQLPTGLIEQIIEMEDLPVLYQLAIYAADLAAEYIPWLGIDRRNLINYDVTLSTDAVEPEDTWINKITYNNADAPLCADTSDSRTDVFLIEVEDHYNEVTITTETSQGTTTDTLNTSYPYNENSQGFALELDVIGNEFAIMVSSVSCNKELESIEFNFGSGANIINPSASTYEASRYITYCEGGCVGDCGDVGTGVVTSQSLTDKCYDSQGHVPEWCSIWYTHEDNNNDNPAFVGGTQEGEDEVYWEKTFKTILTTIQLQNLESITITGEVAYQNIAQFFCDTLAQSCPMEGSFLGTQDVELYNYDSHQWVNIGIMGTIDSTSDQQIFEVTYDGNDVLEFVKSDQIKARIKFNWEGVIPLEADSAPSFMLIDYLAAHLKW